jgi:dihydrofolate synthase/folylpolyglutamate synthase
VGGSNGKGSVCAMLSSCLSAGGVRVGLYTSPHLWRVNERFQINGEEVEDGLLAEGILELHKVFEGKIELSFFEFCTALAFWLFSKQEVEAAIVEVGLGGRLEATNVLLAWGSAITSLSLEHTQWLGGHLDAIAFEKAHIFKPGIPALVSAQAMGASKVFAEHAQSIGAPLWAEGEAFLLQKPAEEGEGGWHWQGFGRRLENIRLSLRGPHQVSNAALALACLELSPFRLEEAALRRGLSQARWPGRLEYVEGKPPLRPPVLLDGAHNPAGIDALALALEQLWPTADIHLLFSVLEDKDLERMAARLFPRCASIHLAPLQHVRARPLEDCLPLAQRFCANSFVCDSVEEALQKAFACCGEHALVVVAGSLYLVGQARECLLEKPDTAKA